MDHKYRIYKKTGEYIETLSCELPPGDDPSSPHTCNNIIIANRYPSGSYATYDST